MSDGGGAQPVWSADGETLYYLDGRNDLVAARVTRKGSDLTFSRRALFRAPPMQDVNDERRVFAPFRDGTFVFRVLADSVAAPTMRVGLNWAR